MAVNLLLESVIRRLENWLATHKKKHLSNKQTAISYLITLAKVTVLCQINNLSGLVGK